MDKKQVVNEAVKNLLTMFQNNTMPEAIAISIIRKQAGDIRPCQSWSLGNRIVMTSHNTQDARGFRQWQTVGRNVNKGARAIYIFAPIITNMKTIDAKGVEHIKNTLLAFKQIAVFRFEDTYGKDLPNYDYTPPNFPPFYNVSQKLGISIQYTPIQGNYYGRYTPKANLITLASHDSVVFFHELAHAVHHNFKNILTGDKAQIEITAELAASVLCHIQGIYGFEMDAWEYIKHYSDKCQEKALRLIMRVLADVETIVTTILELDTNISRKGGVICEN